MVGEKLLGIRVQSFFSVGREGVKTHNFESEKSAVLSYLSSEMK